LINVVAGLIIGVNDRNGSNGRHPEIYDLTIGGGWSLRSRHSSLRLQPEWLSREWPEEADSNLGKDIGGQIMAQPKATIAGGFLLFLRLFGLSYSFLILAAIMDMPARCIRQRKKGRRSSGSSSSRRTSAAGRKPGTPAALAAAEEVVLALPTPASLEPSPSLSGYIEGTGGESKFINDSAAVAPVLSWNWGSVSWRSGENADSTTAAGQFMVRIMEVPLFQGAFQNQVMVVNQPAVSCCIENSNGGRNPLNTHGLLGPEEHQQNLASRNAHLDVPTYLPSTFAILRRHASDFLGIQEAGVAGCWKNNFHLW
jgi:type III secretion protein V